MPRVLFILKYRDMAYDCDDYAEPPYNQQDHGHQKYNPKPGEPKRPMDYPNVILSCNDLRTHVEFRNLVKIYKPTWDDVEVDSRVVYLPNFYPTAFNDRAPLHEREHIDIGCFGAVRPLKNHLTQAVAALQYAEENNKILRFHINGTRVESKGEPVVNNLRKMFGLLTKLVEHRWIQHRICGYGHEWCSSCHE